LLTSVSNCWYIKVSASRYKEWHMIQVFGTNTRMTLVKNWFEVNRINNEPLYKIILHVSKRNECMGNR